MTTINDIKSAEWSLSVASFGEVVEGFADINQCINLILNTAKGSDPLRPEFGSDIWKYLDYGIDTAVPNMVREILDSIGTWERRIQITDVAYEVGEKNATFNILWILEGNKQKGSSQLALSLVSERDIPAPAPIITPIATPAELLAEYIDFEGVLSWIYDAPEGVTFQILRALGEGSFAQIAMVVGEIEYTDTDLGFDSLYKYRVRAVKGSRVSSFSNEAELQTLEPILEFASSAPTYLSVTKTGEDAVIQSDGGISKVYVLEADPENISAFYADDAGDAELNAGITGMLDLSDLSGLRTVRARNQSFNFVPGTWVRNASVNINVSNSITTASRVSDLIDAVILANGGTVTDDGLNYTGLPGQTHASRVLNIGSIELDLADPANTILYEKVIALGTVGWTISTVSTICTKYFDVDTAGATSVSGELEKTRQLAGVTYYEGTVLDLSLYETLANAQSGGATGRLAQGYPLVDAWLRNNANYNAWVLGTKKALRFYSADNIGTGNKSLVAYKAAPTAERSCGTVTEVRGIVTSGLFAWYDFSDSANRTVSGGEYVSLTDKSGNGRTLSAPDAGSRPPLTAAAYNGLDVASFDGVNDRMSASFSSATFNQQSIFIVMKYTVTGIYAEPLSIQDGALNNLIYVGFDNLAVPGQTLIGERLPINGSARLPFASAGGMLSFGALSYYKDAAGEYARFNNDVYYSNVYATGDRNVSIISVGERYLQPLVRTQCQVGEIILYDRALTSTEMDTMTNYLINKWGL